MSEDPTRDLPDGRSFEERVFARFDAMDARFNAMEARFEKRFDAVDARLDRLEVRVQALEVRVETLETQSEKRALETKPIWERALAEILELKERVDNLSRKIEVLTYDVVQVRADQLSLERRMDRLESAPQ